MMWSRSLAAICTLAAMLAAGPTAAAEACMRAGEDGAIAEGRLIERDDAIILKLPQPMCLEGAGAADNVAASAEIHVYAPDDSVQQTLRGLIGKDVHLEGSFMGAVTQHHKAPIVMQVSAADEI